VCVVCVTVCVFDFECVFLSVCVFFCVSERMWCVSLCA